MYDSLTPELLERDNSYINNMYEKFPELIDIIKDIDEKIKEKYSLYADELCVPIEYKYLEYIVAHYRHLGFVVNVSNINMNLFNTEDPSNILNQLITKDKYIVINLDRI